MTQPRRATAAILAACSFAFVAYMTLRPTQAIVVTPTFCIFCGPLGGVDFILNLVLFVPIGVSLRWATGSLRTTAIVGVATTLVIESLQWRLIGGRDASLGDLLANTLGTMIGAWLGTTLFRWLNATGSRAGRLSSAFAIATSLLVAVSAVLLQPIVPRYQQFVLWTPRRPNMDPFLGQLVTLELNGRTRGASESFDPKEAFDTLARSLSMRAHIASPAPDPTRRLAMIVRLANTLEEGFSLAQWRDAAAFRTHMVAVRVKLRSIMVGLDGAFSSTHTRTAGGLVIEGYSDPRAISLRQYPDGESAALVRRTVGLAWALFLPRDVALNQRWWPVNAIWLCMLMLPAAFLAIRSWRTGSHAASKFAMWPVVLVMATLAASPVTGLSPLSSGEWIGVLAGIAAGWVLERWAQPGTPALKTQTHDGSIPL